MERKMIPLGKTVLTNKIHNFELPKNEPKAKNNLFLLGKQGIGKTNLMMLFIFYAYKCYIETKGKYGFIPIVFSPLFEYTKLKNKSTIQGMLPPNQQPKGIDALHFSFRMANVPVYLQKEVKLFRINFSELTTEEIGVFAGFSGNEDALGKIEKILEKLQSAKPNYTVKDFLLMMKPDKPVLNSTYYVFKRLDENGLFDESLEIFDWFSVLKERKPICFHFGDIDDENIYQAIGGILLRTLFQLSNEYINAVYKSKRNVKLTEREQWFLDNFVIGLFFEEAHMFFPPTTTNVLRSFPTHKTYKKISQALGRKRNFKFNFLVSQYLDLIYHGFRTDFDYVFLGSKVGAKDKAELYNLFRKTIISSKDCTLFVSALCANNDFEFSVTNVNDLNKVANNIKVDVPPVGQFKAFLAPCSQ